MTATKKTYEPMELVEHAKTQWCLATLKSQRHSGT